ncbi:MAG: hypothetical protein OXU68_03590 [Bacteroidota bacterium]|nr:hypothetical protein [Bacteroidota bacterium]
MTRRDFMACLPIAAVGLAVADAEERPWWSVPALQEMLSASQINTLGMSYRLRYPDEDNARCLAQLILGAIKRSTDHEAALANAISQEFAGRRTVVLHGWMLSVTEARQCALYSMVGW